MSKQKIPLDLKLKVLKKLKANFFKIYSNRVASLEENFAEKELGDELENLQI